MYDLLRNTPREDTEAEYIAMCYSFFDTLNTFLCKFQLEKPSKKGEKYNDVENIKSLASGGDFIEIGNDCIAIGYEMSYWVSIYNGFQWIFGQSFFELFDFGPDRKIVDNILMCYNFMGAVNSVIKDYLREDNTKQEIL